MAERYRGLGATRAAPAANATYQDVLDALEHQVAEIIGGRLYTHPRPAPRHATATSRLGVELGGPFDRGRGGPGGWRIVDEPELHLGEEVLVPDLAGWRRKRMPEAPEDAYFTLAPDWVCEVLSPLTRKVDLVHKRPIYAGVRVEHLWIIDPAEQILEAFSLTDGRWRLIATVEDDGPVCIAPFDANTFSLAELWDWGESGGGRDEGPTPTIAERPRAPKAQARRVQRSRGAHRLASASRALHW